MMVGLETQVVYLYHSAPVESQEGDDSWEERVHNLTVKWYLPV